MVDVTCVTRAIVPAAIALALTTPPAFAQPCPPLHVRNPDGNYSVPGVQGDIPYSGDHALDAYVQQGPRQRPAVVVIHGGTWSSGSRVAHVGQILDVLTQAGYHWFSVDYRLGGLPRFEESLADIRTALAFIRCRARELGIAHGKQLCIRVMMHFNGDQPRTTLHHVYLEGARSLRDDLPE